MYDTLPTFRQRSLATLTLPLTLPLTLILTLTLTLTLLSGTVRWQQRQGRGPNLVCRTKRHH